MLTHTLSQRTLSEQSRPISRLSPDKSVKENPLFLIYSNKNCAIFQANAPNKITIMLTSICGARCIFSCRFYEIQLDNWSQLRSIREPTFYLILNNKNEIIIRLDSRMICGSLLESYKTNGDFILLGQELVEFLVNHSPMPPFQPLSGKMVSHDDHMLFSLMPPAQILVVILSGQMVSHDDGMLYSLMTYNQLFPDHMVSHDDHMLLSLMPPAQMLVLLLSGQMVSHEDSMLYSLMSHDQPLDQRISHEDFMVRLPIFGSNPPTSWDGSSVLQSTKPDQNLDDSTQLLWTSAQREGFGNPPEGSSGGAQTGCL